jgi:hypothetical protein
LVWSGLILLSGYPLGAALPRQVIKSTSFTLVDKIQVMTYIFLLLCIVLSVTSLRLWKNDKMTQSRRPDRIFFGKLPLLYLVLNLVFTF